MGLSLDEDIDKNVTRLKELIIVITRSRHYPHLKGELNKSIENIIKDEGTAYIEDYVNKLQSVFLINRMEFLRDLFNKMKDLKFYSISSDEKGKSLEILEEELRGMDDDKLNEIIETAINDPLVLVPSLVDRGVDTIQSNEEKIQLVLKVVEELNVIDENLLPFDGVMDYIIQNIKEYIIGKNTLDDGGDY